MNEVPQNAPRRNSVLEKQRRFLMLASITGAAAIGAVLLLGILVIDRVAGSQPPTQSMILQANVHTDTPKIKTIPDTIAAGVRSAGPGENELQGNLKDPDSIGDTLDRTTDDIEAGSVLQMPESNFSDQMPDIDPSRAPRSGDGSLPARGSEKWGGPSDTGSGGGAGRGHGISGGAGDMGQGLGTLAGDRDILLIWVLDSSASMFDKIDEMKQQITVLFKAYDKRMTMSVIAFDSEPVGIVARPTDKVEDVLAAFDKVKADGKKKQIEEINYFLANGKVMPGAGVENTMQAVEYAARTPSTSRRKVVIALMTDEVGDDSTDANARDTLQDLQRGDVSVFVFGPQPNLAHNIVTTDITISDPSFDRAKVPTGTIQLRTRADRGSGLPGDEPVTFDWGVLSPRMEDAARQVYQSGLGPYYLNQLVACTGGRYYFYAGEPGPSAKVRPVYDPRSADYRGMQQALKNLNQQIAEWNRRPSLASSFASQDAVAAAEASARTNLALAEKIITRLKRDAAGDEDMRVNAHRELFLAQLYAAKFRLLEYIAALDNAKGLRFDTVDKGNIRTLHGARIGDSRVSGLGALLKNAPVDFPTYQPMQLVIRSEAEWRDAIENKSGLRMLQEKPTVDFATEMVVVVSAGLQYRSDARIDIVTTFEREGKLMVVVDENLPQTSRRNLDKVYFPNSVLVVPKFAGDVKFIPTSQWAAASRGMFGNSLLGGAKSAEALIHARIAKARVEQKYAGTMWSAIVANVSLDSFRCSQTTRSYSTAPPPPQQPQPQPQPQPRPQPPPPPIIPGGA